MLLELFITLEVLAFVILIAGFLKVNDYRNYLLAFLALVLFLFLAFQAFQIQTTKCTDKVVQSVEVNGTVDYTYDYGCQVNYYTDNTLVYLNLSFALISLLYGLGNIFIKQWRAF